MVFLIGASGHAKVILEILENQGIEIDGLQDINISETHLFDYPIHEEFPNTFDKKRDRVIVSIGNNSIRKRIVESDDNIYTTAIHPSANISKRSTIGEGSVVMAGVCINSGTVVGKHNIINTNASVDHDCLLEDYVHISPNAALAGNVKVGEGTHIGIGACVIQGVTIGKWCTIGAGAVIINDIPDGCTVVGNPGRIIKSN